MSAWRGWLQRDRETKRREAQARRANSAVGKLLASERWLNGELGDGGARSDADYAEEADLDLEPFDDVATNPAEGDSTPSNVVGCSPLHSPQKVRVPKLAPPLITEARKRDEATQAEKWDTTHVHNRGLATKLCDASSITIHPTAPRYNPSSEQASPAPLSASLACMPCRMPSSLPARLSHRRLLSLCASDHRMLSRAQPRRRYVTH